MANWAALQEQLMGKPVAKRAKHGIHFQNTDGSITANFCGKPAHFQDTDGLWKPIDTKLLPLGDGYYGCPHSKVKVHPAGTVKIAGTDYAQRVELPSAQTGLLDGDKLVRKFAFGEQRMWVTEDGFKSEIQLNRIPKLTEARKLIATESGTLSKEYLKSLTTATDANGDVHTVTTLSAFRTWLASAKFPVVIDPDFAGDAADSWIRGSSKTYTTARSTSFTFSNTLAEINVSNMLLGDDFYVDRYLSKFDTSSIGSSSTVTQVNLKLTIHETNGTITVNITKFNWSSYDPVSADNRESAYDAALAADQDGTATMGISGYYQQNTSPNLTTSWVNKTGSTYYGLISAGDVAGTEPAWGGNAIYCTANNATESRRPVLTVTYTAGGSITPIVQYYNRLRRN